MATVAKNRTYGKIAGFRWAKNKEWKNQSTQNVIQKETEKRKSFIRTQRWRLRIKLQKDNTDKQPTVPEENTYNSRSKYDREKKEQQSVLQLAC
jgi:hypothetical protein